VDSVCAIEATASGERRAECVAKLAFGVSSVSRQHRRRFEDQPDLNYYNSCVQYSGRTAISPTS